jgi:hypothetical protein
VVNAVTLETLTGEAARSLEGRRLVVAVVAGHLVEVESVPDAV